MHGLRLPLVETGCRLQIHLREMLKGGVLLGAEESGGIGFPAIFPNAMASPLD